MQLDRDLALAPAQGDELLNLAAQDRERVLVGRAAVVDYRVLFGFAASPSANLEAPA